MSNASLIPVRKDFVFDQTCHACPRKLTSNVAVILQDELGQDFPYGPVCAKNALDHEGQRLLKQIPDFTKAAPGQENEPGAGRGSTDTRYGGSSGLGNTDRQFRRAVTYLLLRQRKLAHIPAANYKRFSAYADIFDQTNSLPEDSIAHLINVERKSGGTKFGFDSLQAVYGYDCCINRTFLSLPAEKQDWLKDVQTSLRKRLYLTEAQAKGVENWFKYIPGHQPLSPKGFQWAWKQK
ncbi:hypothetical protein O4H49_19880 [Kiloniella laminariae]|uniref:Uncharacterized protein n=1 Tax=Kiloniella laminariae TaxID=454162 RepID=A0ABT4LPJ9_9PROT|nr:hypothetical protein [Kiloniella laminariae]MCZ4283054.1 hypothetical protein [Kiloniella laminariae]